jgi:hypothetical protein
VARRRWWCLFVTAGSDGARYAIVGLATEACCRSAAIVELKAHMATYGG